MGVEGLWEQLAYCYKVNLVALKEHVDRCTPGGRRPVMAVDVRVGYVKYVSRSVDFLFQQPR